MVDDEQPELTATARVLRGHGYSTLEAASCEEALSLAATHAIRMLLTDSVLPRMPGTTLAGQLAGGHPGLAVVYMSGDAEPVPAPGQTAIRLRKPFSPRALLNAVAAALDGPAGTCSSGAPGR